MIRGEDFIFKYLKCNVVQPDEHDPEMEVGLCDGRAGRDIRCYKCGELIPHMAKRNYGLADDEANRRRRRLGPSTPQTPTSRGRNKKNAKRNVYLGRYKRKRSSTG